MGTFETPPQPDPSERSIVAQIDERTRILEERARHESAESGPIETYSMRVEKAPISFYAVTKRALGLAQGNDEWTQGIEGELANFTFRINAEHVREVLRKSATLRSEKNFLAVDVVEDRANSRLSLEKIPNLPAYVDGDDIYVKKLATHLTTRAKSNEEKAAILLAFVQSLTYEPDTASDVNFVQPPAYTLAYGGGGCDDFAVLYASLLEACDIPYQMFLGEKHAFVGVEGDFDQFYENMRQSGDLIVRLPDHLGSVMVDGRRYYVAEPTLPNGLIGRQMEGQSVKHNLSKIRTTVGEVIRKFNG